MTLFGAVSIDNGNINTAFVWVVLHSPSIDGDIMNICAENGGGRAASRATTIRAAIPREG